MIVYGVLGTTKDYGGDSSKRWEKWRPTIALCAQPDIDVSEYHLLHNTRSSALLKRVTEDIQLVSPTTKVIAHLVDFEKPWDFEEVYSTLYDFLGQQSFNPEQQDDYAINLTTGTHVAQVCWFLLTESRRFPGKLIQVSPGKNEHKTVGHHTIIDLNLSKYDQIASRFAQDKLEGEAYLKGGIQTRNPKFNQLITQIETVAVRSTAPMLITGPTGAGKSQLAQRIFDLKKRRHLVAGEFVAVNCATFAGDSASQSALFGHLKGSFTGAMKDRQGFLKAADKGVLFLDEIGELPLEAQAMLLHALEYKTFYPLGSDTAVKSQFTLIAGTNKNLADAVEEKRFREDLLARIDVWVYDLPGLSERIEDIEPNIDYELNKTGDERTKIVTFNREARERYLQFATGNDALWKHNFRDLASSIYRMVTLAGGGRINVEIVEAEICALRKKWQSKKVVSVNLSDYLAGEALDSIDPFDQVQLAYVVGVCRKHPSMAAASREMFSRSREKKSSQNDSTRLKKYLAKFDLTWDSVVRKPLGPDA